MMSRQAHPHPAPRPRRFVLAALMVALVVAGSAHPAMALTPECGPGSFWVDGCPAGTDMFPSTGLLIGLDLDLDGERDMNLVLTGPTEIVRQASSEDSGNFPVETAGDQNPAGDDVIDTEIVSMNLTSGPVTVLAGSGEGLADSSLGTIVQQPSDPTKADSFFEVFFKVTLPGGVEAFNREGARVTQVIEQVPPDTVYIHPTDELPVLLWPTRDPQPNEQPIAQLVVARHDTVASPLTVPTLTAWGLGLLVFLLLGLGLLTMLRWRQKESTLEEV